MKKESLYDQWKEHRRQVPVPQDFSASVMARIKTRVPREGYEVPAELKDIGNRAMQWSTAAGLVLIGLFRIFYIAANLIQASPIMPN